MHYFITNYKFQINQIYFFLFIKKDKNLSLKDRQTGSRLNLGRPNHLYVEFLFYGHGHSVLTRVLL